MKILVLSDIHANLIALEAVLRDAGSFDATWFLGDLVGYGPSPNECVALLRELPDLTCLLGNHDSAALGMIDTDAFNPEAQRSVLWTRKHLNADNRRFLESCAPTASIHDVRLAHGSPRSPIWEYLLDTNTAAESFAYFTESLCFVGHTHVPVIFEAPQGDQIFTAGLLIPEPNTTLQLQPRMIVNPGSVGQPRDRDPRAAYALFDPQALTWDYRRVPYDVAAVQQHMKVLNLPARHAQRLASGW
ncbi:MAG: metallophosphoesterase family protein [Anaerolineales bacterium]